MKRLKLRDDADYTNIMFWFWFLMQWFILIVAIPFYLLEQAIHSVVYTCSKAIYLINLLPIRGLKIDYDA